MFPNAVNYHSQNETITYLQALIQAESITPNDAGTIEWLSTHLESLGFETKLIISNGVKNLIACQHFSEGPILGFIGHVDVVPANSAGWHLPPFSGEVLDGYIYGRGTADMKGGIAAMLSATNSLIKSPLEKVGSLYWLITSDEEGEAEYGSKEIAKYLKENNIVLDACLVGEPTADKIAGDAIKNGRRGALSGRIHLTGKSGHVAYPENSVNAAHLGGIVINNLANIEWDRDEIGSKTGLQVTGVSINNSIDNIIPDNCEITFNVRYSHNYSGKDIISEVEKNLAELRQYLSCDWERPCEPYYTGHKNEHCFLTLVEKTINEVTGQYPKLTTAGGTSDGRFFSNSHTQVIECGVSNETIHQVNERIALDDLAQVEKIYESILIRYLLS